MGKSKREGKRAGEAGGLAKSAIFFLKVHIRNTWNQKDLAYLSVRTLWIAA